MSERHIERFYDDILYKDVKTLTEILASISGSYRVLVGAAGEFNGIALVHRNDVEAAIERADDLGNIIDDVEGVLKKMMKLYLKEMECKASYHELHYCKSSTIGDSRLLSQENLYDTEKK
jgi:hypothetical protein